MKEIDVGFTHVAFVVRELDKSIAFYERYAGLSVVHRREPDVPDARKVAWLSDHTRPFALVLVQADKVTDTPLGHFGHLGVACADREEIDRKTCMARAEGVLRKDPEDAGEPVVITFSSQTLMVILWSFLMDSRLVLKQSDVVLSHNTSALE